MAANGFLQIGLFTFGKSEKKAKTLKNGRPLAWGEAPTSWKTY